MLNSIVWGNDGSVLAGTDPLPSITFSDMEGHGPASFQDVIGYCIDRYHRRNYRQSLNIVEGTG